MALTRYTISENIFRFEEENAPGSHVDSYLILGEKRALAVDALQNDRGLYAAMRQVTDLPLDLVITHAHPDHAGPSTAEFAAAGCQIYMNMDDWKLIPGYTSYGPKQEWFTDLEDGHRFDLGGVRLEVIRCGGHTMGSVALLDRERQLLFPGDTVGSGSIWMQLPESLVLDVFAANLQRLYDEVRPLTGLKVYPGHYRQSPEQLTGQYVKDILTITKRLVTGVWEGRDEKMQLGELEIAYKAIRYGTVRSDYCYNPDKLKQETLPPSLEALKDLFKPGTLKKNGCCLDYLLFEPETEPGKKYPLVLYLHGAGERSGELRRTLANPGATSFASPAWQEKHSCYVLAPQCPPNRWWTDTDLMEVLMHGVRSLPHLYPIDPNRVYVTGLSMGGMGTWALISRYPRYFAAAMPVCGAGDPFAVKAAKNVPVWAFHAQNDPVVPMNGISDNPSFPGLYGTSLMVTALQAAGNPNVRLTSYSKEEMDEWHLNGHASWVPAYLDYLGEESKEWLFSFSREDRYEVQLLRPGVWNIDDYAGDSMYLVEGTEKALLIDTGWGKGDLLEVVHSLTRLPVELAVTHGHGDHIYHADLFDHFYMAEAEKELLAQPFMEQMLDGRKLDLSRAVPVREGDRIDLGGGYEIEVLALPGHTPGSVCYVDRKRGLCFCGDTLGVWMQVPMACDLSVYRENLLHFAGQMISRGYETFPFFSGHRQQEGGSYPFDTYQPFGMQRVMDLIKLIDLVLHDDVDYELFKGMTFGEPAYIARKGLASIVFGMSNRK